MLTNIGANRASVTMRFQAPVLLTIASRTRVSVAVSGMWMPPPAKASPGAKCR